MLFYQIIEEFKKAKVPYAIVGGYALALHGIVRATVDIDFVLKLDLKSYELAENCFKKIGLTSRIPVRAEDIIKMRQEYITQRNLIAWSFVDYKNPTKQVDILITTDISELNVELISVGGYKVAVASLQDLLRMKTQSGRPQDLVDIVNIKEALNERKKS
jgi:hypothetical protein